MGMFTTICHSTLWIPRSYYPLTLISCRLQVIFLAHHRTSFQSGMSDNIFVDDRTESVEYPS